MDHDSLYKQAIRQMDADAVACARTGKRLVLGYTSDLDVVLEWNGDVFARIATEFLKEARRYAPGDRIDTVEDFARIVLHFLASGSGGEIDIMNPSLCAYLEQHFETTYMLGGTCAQGAAALGAVGFPVTAYITDRSKAVCGLIDRPGMALYANGRIASVAQSASLEPPVRHIILQYPKDAAVTVQGVTYTAPVSNRLILDFDTIHKIVPIELGFLTWCEENAKDICVLCVSGFNAILDPAIMAERLNQLTRHYAAFRNANPEAFIYLEGAYYLNPEVKDLAFETLALSIDILGMNEEELVEHAARFGLMTDKEDLNSILASLDCLLTRYPAKGIVMHTKDYSMYYGQRLPGVDFEKGLALGNLLSATRARTGRYGSREDCMETLETVPLSPAGLKMAAELKEAEPFGRFVTLVPTRYMERPKVTIGLGDTFMAGMLTAFIQ